MLDYTVIIRTTNDNGEKYDLPIVNVPKFLIDISAIEVGEIGSVFGIATQEFQIPGDDIANQFFNNVFNYGTTPAVALNKSVPAQVLVDGEAVYAGKLYINNLVSDEYNNIIYNCVVVNETIDFRILNENTALADLNWSYLNHSYSYVNVSKSWEDDLFNGKVFYPLINYGSDDIAATPAFEFGGNRGQMDNFTTPLQITQFLPAIQAKEVVDNIFNSVNYKYSSSFFDSALFKQLYILTNDNSDSTFVNPTSGSYVWANTPQSFASGFTTLTYTKLLFTQEVFDSGNNWNPATSTYTAKFSGVHNFQLNIPYRITSNFGPLQVNRNGRRVTLQFFINGSTTASKTWTQNIPNSVNGVITTGQIPLSLNVNETVEVKAVLQSPSANGIEQFTTQPSDQNGMWLRVINASVVGGIVNMGNIWDPEVKVLDFIQALVEKFNLVIEPLSNQKNVLSIEPYNTWAASGQKIDWTHKFDRSIKYKIEHPALRLPKKFRFSDDEDSDILNQDTLQGINKVYGEYTYVSDSDLPEGEKQIGGFFAATPVKYIPGSDTVVLPWLCEKQQDFSIKSYNFKSRLLFKQPYQVANGAKGLIVSGLNFGTGSYYILDESIDTPIAWTKYRTLLATNTSPTDFQTTQDIHYQNIGYWPYQQDKVNGQALYGAYNQYWAYYINSLYDIDARILTCNIVLDPSEIKDIKLNNRYFIDSHYWRINKINGADLVAPQSVEVELIKELPRNIPFGGRKRVQGLKAEDIVDVVESGYGNDGSVSLVRYDDGNAVTGSVLTDAAGKFNIPIFDATPVWNNQTPVVLNPNVIAVGNVKQNNNLNNVIAVGSEINISDNAQNVSAIGAGIDVFDAGSNINVQGSNISLYESNNTSVIYALTESRVVTQSLKSVLINPIYDVGYYPAQASGSNIFTDKTGSVYLGNIIVQGTTEFRQGVDAYGDIKLDGVSIKTLLSGSANKQIGQFYDTTTQNALVVATPYAMKLNTTDISNGVSITGIEQSEIRVANAGYYNLQFSAQLFDNGGSGDNVWIWFRKNGTDIPNSATKLTSKGGNDAFVAAWNYVAQLDINDYVEIMWLVDDTSIRLNYEPALPSVPAIPSVIVTMTQI